MPAAAAPKKIKIAVWTTAAGFDSTAWRQTRAGLRLLLDQKGDRLESFLYDEESGKALQKKDIDMAKLNNPAAYHDAALKLKVDYFLVINMEKPGALVQAIFRRYNSCATEAVPEYEDGYGGAFDDFIQTGMATKFEALLTNLLPQKCRHIDYRYALIALGGGVVCYVVSEWVTPDPPPEKNVLP